MSVLVDFGIMMSRFDSDLVICLWIFIHYAFLFFSPMG